MNSWDKCKNCGGDYALHHYETNQCPRNGVEAPLNRKQEWMTTTFEIVDTRDAEIATLRTDLAVAQAVIVKDTELMRTDEREQEALRADLATAQATVTAIRELIDPLDGQSLEDAISDMLHDDSSYEPYRDTIAALRAESAGRLDALNSWAKLWAHICTATGCADYLPSEANFDAMIDKLRARIATLEASQRAHEEDCAVLPENVSVTEFVTAQAEQLRAFESAEHCQDCGWFMVLPADAPNDAKPFCPFCLCEKQAEQLRAARSSFNAISTIPPHFTDAAAISEAILIARAWLAANPEPVEQRTIIDAYADGM